MEAYWVAYKHGGRYGKVWVAAHTEIEAKEIARIQIQSTYGKSKFVTLQVWKDGEPKPFDKEANIFLVKKA